MRTISGHSSSSARARLNVLNQSKESYKISDILLSRPDNKQEVVPHKCEALSSNYVSIEMGSSSA